VWQKSEVVITAISYSDPTWSTGVRSAHELHEIALKMRSMWQRGNMLWQDFLILKVRILQLLHSLEWLSKILMYSLHLGEPFLPVGAQALQRTFHLSLSQATVLTSFLSILFSCKIIYIHSSQVFPLCVFPCVLAFQPIVGYSYSSFLLCFLHSSAALKGDLHGSFCTSSTIDSFYTDLIVCGDEFACQDILSHCLSP